MLRCPQSLWDVMMYFVQIGNSKFTPEFSIFLLQTSIFFEKHKLLL